MASIRPSTLSGQGRVNMGIQIDGAKIRCLSFSLKDYIGMAYRIKAPQIFGPDWIESARFDITAVLPPGGGAGQLPEMFQALLAGRFRLKAHKEKKEFPVYMLTVAKGPLKIKEAASNSDVDQDLTRRESSMPPEPARLPG